MDDMNDMDDMDGMDGMDDMGEEGGSKKTNRGFDAEMKQMWIGIEG